MPEPTAGRARNSASVDEAILLLGTKVGWRFEELPDRIRNASLLRRLAHESYILARPQIHRSLGQPIDDPAARWQSPDNYHWECYLANPVRGPDLKLTDLGRVRFEDLQKGCERGGEAVANSASKPQGWLARLSENVAAQVIATLLGVLIIAIAIWNWPWIGAFLG